MWEGGKESRMISNFSKYQLNKDCYTHKMLYMNLKVITNHELLINAHTKKKGIQA